MSKYRIIESKFEVEKDSCMMKRQRLTCCYFAVAIGCLQVAGAIYTGEFIVRKACKENSSLLGVCALSDPLMI